MKHERVSRPAGPVSAHPAGPVSAPVLAVTLAAALAAGLLLAPAASAAGPRFEISPFAGYRIGGEWDSDSDGEGADIDDGNSWGVGFGLYRDERSYWELLYSRRSAGLETDDPALRAVDVTIEYFHFGGTLLFEQPQGFTTFVSLTAGLTRLEGSPGRYSSENEFSASLAGGLRFAFSEAVHATFGVRGYATLVDSNTGFLCVSDPPEGACLVTTSGNTFWELEAMAGLNFRFGGR
jgi:hypothetical protein